MKTVIASAFVAALISFLTGAVALMTVAGVQTISDVHDVSWVVLGCGSALVFLKDIQASLMTPHLNGSLTRKVTPPVVKP